MAKTKKRAESRCRYYIRSQSSKRGWNVKHLSSGGECLEEQEIASVFPNIGLGLDKPDFLFCLNGEPSMIVEAKNDFNKIDEAIEDAIYYANQINSTLKYKIKLVVGAAGEEDHGFNVSVRYLRKNKWLPLKSHGYEITTIPSKREVELALEADDSTTTVTVPSSSEFIDVAIELSGILRLAKVEAPLRPKVIGAIVLAMYQGEVEIKNNALKQINELVSAAINESVDLDTKKKKRLTDALRLTGNDYDRLNSQISRITTLLRRLNIRSVLQTDTDFLGLFYEAFLRYGYDNNALGIVFTPRHITRFCVELVDVKATDRIIDIACGTGGFLVSAFDKMIAIAKGPKAIQKVKQSLYGFDTNPTIWALSTLNMFFRGDGKSHIENSSCFDSTNRANVNGLFTRAFLNPPFSQEGEPERDFIDAAMNALEPEGILAVVVKAGIFADDENKTWRNSFVKKHTVLAVISLPEDLFYPTAAPTSILISKAHIPQEENSSVMMARIWNDGFQKLKNRRIEVAGSQLSEILECFNKLKRNRSFESNLAISIDGKQIQDGAEWSPQQWLPQPLLSLAEIKKFHDNIHLSLYQAVASIPELADQALKNFTNRWNTLEELPYNKKSTVDYFFEVYNGKSTGESNYTDGDIPYISSGDTTNSIIRMVSSDQEQVFEYGGITVTAFGQACLQPWQFVARGNGGSAVRILIPKYRMSVSELIWFASEINAQKWRFFYARMAIKSRLELLEINSPPEGINDDGELIAERLLTFKQNLLQLISK